MPRLVDTSQAIRASWARPRARWLALALVLWCGWSSPALAHKLTFSVYSKYEATTSGNEIAFVFALDKKATLQLVEQYGGVDSVDEQDLGRYRELFSEYLHEHLYVTNNGHACTPPSLLYHFGWDEETSRVLAVTKFSCAEPLDELTIRSLVTHDMPTSHATMGDLQHGLALVRHRFVEDDTEAHVVLHRLPQTHRTFPKPQRRRGRFSFVPVPDTKRRYNNWAAAAFEAPIVVVEPNEPFDEPNEIPPTEAFVSSVGEGLLHIFSGYDHILFVITLVLTVRGWRQLGVIVTSFTVAHSLTLAGATFGLVSIAASIVEPMIALSVLVVAVDALVRPRARARTSVVFGFGLVHGFGLSEVLVDLGLRGEALATALLGFNVGVELGQLAIVAPLFPAVIALQKRPEMYGKTRRVVCTMVAVLAAIWLHARVLAALS